jgi:hypothetical protein
MMADVDAAAKVSFESVYEHLDQMDRDVIRHHTGSTQRHPGVHTPQRFPVNTPSQPQDSPSAAISAKSRASA